MEVRRASQHSFHNLTRGWSAERSGKEARRPLIVAIENLLKQLVLVAEGGIKARPRDAERRGQICDRGAVVSPAPEHQHRAVERFVQIELARSSERRGSTFTGYRSGHQLDSKGKLCTYRYRSHLFSWPDKFS
jgi:hypothetical protein